MEGLPLRYDDRVFVPRDMPEGIYELEMAIVSTHTPEPVMKPGISGINEQGWYPMGSLPAEP